MKKLDPILVNIISAVTILVLAAVSYFFYFKWSKSQALIQNPTLATKEEIKSITSKLGKLIELPTDEEPTIATVLDKTKLKDQPFFKKAENGDKVIMYVKSLKAILYRPSINKVIDFSIITMTPQPLNVALYNGTNKVGLTNDLKEAFTANISGLNVVVQENAKKDDYEKTLVVDLSGNRENEAKQLAQLLGASIGKLPAGEQKPSSVGNLTPEVLIILGNDYKGLIGLPAASPSGNVEQ